MPFAGIFFLWFIGVVRARLGRLEDQFFSAVFLGSGLIFLAMVFVATGVAGAIVTGYARDPGAFPGSSTYYFARDLVAQIFGIYALRMACGVPPFASHPVVADEGDATLDESSHLPGRPRPDVRLHPFVLGGPRVPRLGLSW